MQRQFIKSYQFLGIIFCLTSVLLFSHCDYIGGGKTMRIGTKVDSLHGVYVYYNGSVGNVSGRNKTADGYNLGLKYQCVEFVKRYYYERYNHKMPNSYGHAKSFFIAGQKDKKYIKKRGLTQFNNPSSSKPKVGDLVVFGPSLFNKFGHVAIISKVGKKKVEIIQQNPGKRGSSRKSFKLIYTNNKYMIKSSRLKGWLRKT